VRDVRFTGRAAQGVTLFRVANGEKVSSVAWLIQEDEDEEGDVIDGDTPQETSTE